MLTLVELVRDYLLADGFTEIETSLDAHYVIVDRPDVGAFRDTRIVWVIPDGVEPSRHESTLRPLIERLRTRYPDAKGTVLLSAGGFSRSMRQRITEQRIRVRVPIQFFDTAFKVEEAPKAASVISQMRELDPLRVRQPYQMTDAQGEVTDEGPDLLDRLSRHNIGDENPSVQIVVGRAGIGKTFLSRALFAILYQRFSETKKARGIGSRPIPLLPEHMKGVHALRTRLLIENFLRTDVAAPVNEPTFKWLLINGFTTWLLDGLDELITGDEEFFDYILDVVTSPHSRANVLVWSRDSLVTTSDSFLEFREQGQGVVQVYRLLEWDYSCKRDFAWLRHTGHTPAKGEEEPPRISRFLDRIARPPTNVFSGVPFYCKVLWEEELLGDELRSEVDILDHMIESMLSREIEQKKLIDRSIFEEDGIDDWLEAVAVEQVEDGKGVGVDIDIAREYGESVVRIDIGEEQKEDVIHGLLRFPFFTQGAVHGGIAFTHELIAQAIAARHYSKKLIDDAKLIADRIRRVNLEEPVLLRLIAQRVDRQPAVRAITRAMTASGDRSETNQVLLALLMILSSDRNLILTNGLNLEDSLLSRLHFHERDLSGVSFRRSDLSYARFEGCDLRGARFEGAFLKDTQFAGNEMQSADFGNMSRVVSVRAGGSFLDRDEEIERWVAKETERGLAPHEPCPTARQLCHLFQKFITPMGKFRRAALKGDAIVAGKRYTGAASPGTLLRESERRGYLVGPDHRGQYRRAQGDKYSECVRMVKESKVSEGLGAIVEATCPKPDCTHELRN